MLPKTAAFNAPDRIALAVAKPMSMVVKVLGPVLMAIEALVRWMLKLVGMTSARISRCCRRTKNCAARSICSTAKAGWRNSTATCSAACSICANCVSDVMIHRTNMITLNVDDPPEEWSMR